MKIYIAGKITGCPNFRQQFMAAEWRLAEMGFSVMNPAWVCEYPAFGYEDYIAVSHAMLERCEAVFLLPNWGGSAGAKKEKAWAEKRGLKVFDGNTGEAGCWSELRTIAAQEQAEREARLGKGLKDTLREWFTETLRKINEPGVKKMEDAALRGELSALQRVYDYVVEAEKPPKEMTDGDKA